MTHDEARALLDDHVPLWTQQTTREVRQRVKQYVDPRYRGACMAALEAAPPETIPRPRRRRKVATSDQE